jgi:hypothetical protein
VPDADEQRLLQWLTSAPADPPPTKPQPDQASQPSGDTPTGPDQEAQQRRDEQLRAMTRRLNADSLAAVIRVRSPRLSKPSITRHAEGWSHLVSTAEQLTAWLDAGLSVGDHQLAQRLINAGVTPSTAKAVLSDPAAMTELR